MNIIVGCEESQVVTIAFREHGHNSFSCDLRPCSGGHPEWHIQDDILSHLNDGWDMGIFHPPCTYISVSGNRYYAGTSLRKDAIDFVWKIWNAPIKKLGIENPVGQINRYLPDMPKPQYVQPYHFGEDASKKTGLWLRNLPPLQNGKYIEPRMVCKCGRVMTYQDEFKYGCPDCGPGLALPRWSNQTDSGQNRLAPSPTRQQERSRTYRGIAIAMAEQWS